MIRTPSGTGAVTQARTTVTSAPRSRAASARANPIFPLESFVIKRTGSSRSLVAPAVTSTFSPERSFPDVRMPSTASTTASGSLMRPAPRSPHARIPESGPIKRTPRSFSVRRFACVASAVHMPVFMAGASRTGALVASTVVESMSSAIPAAIFAMILAVAGAITKTSARCARATCSTFQVSGVRNVSVTTGLAESVWKVSGATNSVAFRVMITWTFAPR